MRKSSSIICGVLTALLLLLGGMIARAADVVDASGTWQLTVLDTGRTFTPSFALKQNGDQLIGTYKNSMGDNPASGTVKGKEVTLNAEIKSQDGQKRIATYIGSIEGNTMTGKLQTTRADVTFTAQRQ